MATAIKTISATFIWKRAITSRQRAKRAELYGYGHGNVLFKPTKATKNPFRSTGEDAMSYFVGAEAMKNDKFLGEGRPTAINGGKGWKEVVFANHQIELNADTAIAMGSYDFTCATTGDVATVEYTFGYKRSAEDGKARIFLHHSSVPYGSYGASEERGSKIARLVLIKVLACGAKPKVVFRAPSFAVAPAVACPARTCFRHLRRAARSSPAPRPSLSPPARPRAALPPTSCAAFLPTRRRGCVSLP